MTSASPPRSNRRGFALGAGIIGVVLAVLYGPSLSAPFLFDDRVGILANPALHNIENWKAWLQYNTGMPRPLLNLSFTINYEINGSAPWGYRLVNVIIHACNTGLVMLIARAWLRSIRNGAVGIVPVCAAGAMFAVHPLATEAVVFIWSRSTSLMALPYFAAIALWMRATPTSRGAAVACAVVAMLVKEEAVTLIPVLMTLEWARGSGESIAGAAQRTRYLIAVGVLGAVAIGLVLWRMAVGAAMYDAISWTVREAGDYGRALVERTYAEIIWHTMLTQVDVLAQYARLAGWPVHQSVDHAEPLLSGYSEGLRRGILILAGLTVLVAVPRTRRKAALPVALILFPLGLFLFIPLGDAMVERRMYIPLAGIALSVAALAAWMPTRPAQALLACSIAAYAVLTVTRLGAWESRERLWTDAIQHAPYKIRPRQNLGQVLFERGAYDRTEGLMRSVLAQHNHDHRALIMLAAVELRRGDPRRAAAYARQAIVVRPYGATEGYYNLGLALEALGQPHRAVAAYRAAVTLKPDYSDALNNLGAILAQLGRYSEGIAHLEKARDIGPPTSRVYVNLANAYMGMGAHARSLAAARRAMTLAPESPEAAYLAAAAAMGMGELGAAFDYAQRSLMLNPGFWPAHDLVHEIRMRLARTPQERQAACMAMAEALRRLPHDAMTPGVVERAQARGCPPPQGPDAPGP